MRIEYETNHADVEAWIRRSLTLPETKRAVRKQTFLTALSSGFIVGVMCYSYSQNILVSAPFAVAMFLVMACFGGSVRREQMLKATRRAIDADPTSPAIGYHTLEVTPDAITETCSHHTLSLRWEAVAGAIRTDDHLFILLRSNAAIIVPFRSFTSEADRGRFIQEVLRFVPLQKN